MPVVPFIPLIASGVGAATSLFGGRRSSTPTASSASTNTPLDPSMVALNNSLKSLADFQQQQGQAILPRSLNALGTSENFFRTLLGGDRDSMMSLLGPQLNAIGAQDQAQQRSLAELLPRGGYVTDRLGNLSTATTGKINDTLLNYRPAAATSLANIGNEYGNLASSLISGSGASSSSALSALLGQRGQDLNTYLQRAAQSQQNTRSLGEGIGSILGILLGPGGILNRGSSGSSGGWGTFNPGFPATPPWGGT